ncbi:unnamed protein product (macronuclear) [Paramecium tetraurelia]|uniref:GOLD domain-containing protein n=1 Tax=Paramecium tetraurelia TaxID=5888 RepID=A0BUP4_PARTE|nr:uncharacterized protein GSPATT00005507001 [Paramecium tetraurelia]CAK62261.1 unnamed protein product [Paramecium tetraurelia]|eukprot:XP_001429659.1 hypothetical protein (macronuclear) [Paramecium tetraurelia strain d4-2]
MFPILLGLFTLSWCNIEETKDIMQDWDKYMRGFLPDDMISFQIEKGGEEIFIETIKKTPTNIRGTFFIPIYTLDTIDFKVIDPSGSMIYAKMMKKEAVFSFNATEKGDYQLIFQNKRAKESKVVQFAIDVAKSDKEEIEQNDIDPIENGVQGLLQKIRDVFYSTKLNELKSKGALADVQKINKQLMILTFIETVAICGVTAWQVYYIKKLLNDRRLV